VKANCFVSQKERPPKVPDNFGFTHVTSPAFLSQTQGLEHKISKEKILLKREVNRHNASNVDLEKIDEGFKHHDNG
jgi:hypothetical protein